MSIVSVNAFAAWITQSGKITELWVNDGDHDKCGLYFRWANGFHPMLFTRAETVFYY